VKGSDGGFYSSKGKGGGGAVGGPAIPLPNALKRKLQALNYPEAVDSISLQNQSFCKVVLWLEEEKIRLYEPLQRRPLRDFGKSWWTAAFDYCRELGMPIEEADFNERNVQEKLRVLNRLTNYAIHDVYRDKVDAQELAVVRGAAGVIEKRQSFTSLVAPLNKLLECFALPLLPADAEDSDTLAALRCVHARICPPSDTEGDRLDIDKLPVAMDVPDPVVRRAACVLRLLHGIELRALQENINDVINQLQQLTADPKTDVRLGRVGR